MFKEGGRRAARHTWGQCLVIHYGAMALLPGYYALLPHRGRQLRATAEAHTFMNSN
jgi:hypothetical protein